VDESAPPRVEKLGGLTVIRGSGNCRDWNGIHYKLGMSSKNVGARELSMNVATIPPSGVARAHIHVGFELMLYILEGRVRHAYGPGLTKTVDNQAGDFIFIEPGVPHEVYNLSDREPVVAVVARSAADEWDRIEPYDPTSDATLRA
jgi:uncharacterized RmlC-like cupin family protein